MAKYASFHAAVSGGTLAKAGVVISIGDINRTKEMTEDDDLETAESGYAKRRPGMKSVEDITLVIRHKKGDAGQTVLDDSFEEGELIDFEARYPDAGKTAMKGKGYVSGISLNTQDKDTTRVERSITIAVDGGITEGTWTE